MKSMLFNTDMVRAFLEDRKTVTRRVVKPHCRDGEIGFQIIENANTGEYVCIEYIDEFGNETRRMPNPYRPGDILYVRETWAAWSRTMGTPPVLYYKTDGNAPDGIKWRPSIHMSREAARIFLRVTDVRVERLQKISAVGIEREGVRLYDDICRDESWKPSFYDPDSGGTPSLITGFSKLWDSTIKPKDRALYGWEANPWVWVIEFERISREAACPC